MGNVTPLFRCGRCGGAADLVHLELDGEPVATARACAACVQHASDFLAEERMLFDAIVAAGVDEACANVMMMARHRHMREVAKR
jgi:hypothetical protein